VFPQLHHYYNLVCHRHLAPTIVARLLPLLRFYRSISTSLVPYKSLCWSLASFTPDVMPTAIRSSLALLTGTNVTTCFQHRLFNITRHSVADSLYSTLQLLSTEIIVPVFPYPCLPVGRVHHQNSFPFQQHKVIRQLADYLWGSSAEGLLSSLKPQRWPVLFARPPHVNSPDQSLPSFVQHLHPYNWMKFKTHTFMFMTAAVFEARPCSTWPNEIKKTKLYIYTSPAAGINFLLWRVNRYLIKPIVTNVDNIVHWHLSLYFYTELLSSLSLSTERMTTCFWFQLSELSLLFHYHC